MTEQLLDAALETGAALAKPKHPTMPSDVSEGVPYVAIPAEYKIESLERLLPVPTRKIANVVLTDAASFIAYTKKHGSLDECVIYAQIDNEASKCGLVAIINDHKSDSPQWRDNRCSFSPNLSVEWKRWTGKNKVAMSQTDFATWIEDNLGDIVGQPNMPTGQDMLQLAIGFTANAEKRLRSKINLQSGGVRFEFVDDEDKDTRTSMEVFQRFTVGVPVFEGSTNAYPLEARLKYREKDGKVTFWFELIRPDRVFKTAVNDELKAIKDATGFLLLAGTP